MTDKEIINALECLCGDEIPCKDCAYKSDAFACRRMTAIDALDLINRQQAAIERLTDYNENLQTANTALSNEILEAKSEAVREFAERLKDKSLTKWDYHDAVDIEEIDNLVKEMVGDTE